MKNAIYFMPKALFVLKIFSFLSWHFGHHEKRFEKKAKVLILKFMSLRTGKQIITIQMLRNISRSKDIKAMKMGQFIEYNMGRIFLEKNMQKLNQED